MYVPPRFRPASEEAVKEFLLASQFATLVTSHNATPVATHLPVEYVEADGERVVFAHMARANPQWREFSREHPALLIVEGPHGYVSPHYYDDTEVPTWNYISAHVYGHLEPIEDDALLLEILKRQIQRNESPRECPVLAEHYDEAFLRRSQRGAVGLRLTVERVEAAFKLSQNRSLSERQRLAMSFAESNDSQSQALGSAMKASLAAAQSKNEPV